MKLAGTANTIRGARRPMTKGHQRVVAVGTTLAVVGMAYVFWGRATDSGFVGWIDAMQARIGGEYDEKLSVYLAMVCVMVASFAVATPVGWFGRSAREAVPAKDKTPRDMLAQQSRVMLVVCLGLVAAIWVGGFGAYEYYTWRARAEAQATYQPVDAGAPVGAAADLRFVALTGRTSPGGYIKLTENHKESGTLFIPLVARSVRDPHVAAHWVLRTDGSNASYLPAVLYGHNLGEKMPQTILDAFAREGIPLATDAVMVSYVQADSEGHVRDTSGDDLFIFLGGAGGISVLLVVMMGAAWLKVRWQYRKLAPAR